MKVKMLEQITGTRNGVAWPAPGETVELPSAEAVKLCEAGLAEPVNTRGSDTEKATAPAGETRGAAKKTSARKPR